jgi:hypothetical protein
MNKSKKQIEVVLNGLNEFGVSELKEYYKYNFHFGYFVNTDFNIGDTLSITKKRFKNVKAFYRLGLDNYVGNFNCTQSGENRERVGGYFSLQIKHFNYKIYEVEVVETLTEVTLEG